MIHDTDNEIYLFLYIQFTFIIMSITFYVLVVLDISPKGFLEDLRGYI